MTRDLTRAVRGSASGLLLLLLVLLLLGAGVAYFASDVFRSKADETYRQFSEWTPENIVADPAGYLAFCESEARRTLEALKAREIAAAQSRARFEEARTRSQRKVELGETALEELKGLYRAAEAGAGFPATWRGKTLERPALRAQILAFDRELRSERSLRERLDEALLRFEEQGRKIEETRARCREQLVEIAASREALAVESLDGGLRDRLVGMRAVLEQGRVVAAEEGLLSLEDLESAASADSSDASFDEIMAR